MFKIGNFDLNGNRTYIIAELSANHGGNINIARKTIEAAKKAGADAIKLQTYTPDTLTIDSNKKDFLISGGTLWDNKSLYELYGQAFLPWEWHSELFEYARSLDIDIFSSPFDKTAVDFLEKFSPSAYKIASFEITDYALVEYVASKKKPIIISTGIATIDEIQDVVDICRAVGNNKIILLKCTSAYPAPLEEANLKMIKNLRETFDVVSGFSDHTLGFLAPVVAVSLGAKVVEKHFILDKSIESADSEFSLDQEEFGSMVEKIRDTEKILGKVDYSLSNKKKKSRQFARSLYVVKNIKKGELYSEENIRSIRPGYGKHPKFLKDYLGKRSDRDYSAGDRLE